MVFSVNKKLLSLFCPSLVHYCTGKQIVKKKKIATSQISVTYSLNTWDDNKYGVRNKNKIHAVQNEIMKFYHQCL